MTKHNLIKTDYGCHCTICHWAWRSLPTTLCPGVPRFARWGNLPNYLKTETQLSQAGLKPRDPLYPDACLQGRLDKTPRYWLYDERQAVPRHKRTTSQGENLAQERAIAAEARKLWESRRTYTEMHSGVAIQAVPLVRGKFIGFRARTRVQGIPGEFYEVEVETNLSLPTHLNAIAACREFLAQLLREGIPNRTPDRDNFHEYLREWRSGFIRVNDSGAGFYIRLISEKPPSLALQLAKPNINYWSWAANPESRQICGELITLLTLPEPNNLVRQVLEALPEGKDPFFMTETRSKNSRWNMFENGYTTGRYAEREDKHTLRNAFIDWHQETEALLGTDALKSIYQVVYGASWELIQEIIEPLCGEWWEVLGVKPNATKVEVKQAYRRLVRKYHPDINASPRAHERAVTINCAYENFQKLANA